MPFFVLSDHHYPQHLLHDTYLVDLLIFLSIVIFSFSKYLSCDTCIFSYNERLSSVVALGVGEEIDFLG